MKRQKVDSEGNLMWCWYSTVGWVPNFEEVEETKMTLGDRLCSLLPGEKKTHCGCIAENTCNVCRWLEKRVGYNRALEDCKHALKKARLDEGKVTNILKDTIRNAVVASDWEAGKCLFFNEDKLSVVAKALSNAGGELIK